MSVRKLYDLQCDGCGKPSNLPKIAEWQARDVGTKLRDGWPKCCGYTMRWITQRELEAEGSPRG